MKVTKYYFYILFLEIMISCDMVHARNLSSGRWIVWSSNVVSTWEDAFVTGNGVQGLMVVNDSLEERFICTHEDLFIRGWDRHKKTVPYTAHLLPQVRQLMENGKSDEADRLLTEEADRQLRKMGANQRWPLIPHPAFDFCVDWGGKNRKAFHRQLDLETGECKNEWQYSGDFLEESYFSSRVHQVNVIRFQRKSGKPLDLLLSLKETPGRKGIHFEHNLEQAFDSVVVSADSCWLTYHANYSKDSGGYDGVARVILRGGHIYKKGTSLQIQDANEVLVLIRVTPWENASLSDIDAIKKDLLDLPSKYFLLLKPHADKHGEMFRRMQFDLGNAEDWKKISVEMMLDSVQKTGVNSLFLEQIAAMGRYLLISSCGKYPPPLQGIWGGTWKPAWIGGFVWDSNLNLAISAASMSNLNECAESYTKYVEHLLPGWRLNAQNYLGCRGFIVAHYNDPVNGYLTHFGYGFPWMFWAGGAGWNIRPLYEYAMLMGDKTYLKEHVYPLYKEMANFYEDYLRMGSDGLFHICPSISPENTPVGTNTWLSKDATMDVAIAREVFYLLCEMGSVCGATPMEMQKWQLYLERLPYYRINSDGALAEWIDDHYVDIYNHRHNSHLYPVFPGFELVGEHANVVFQKAACVALDKRFAFDTSSAHGLIHLALQAARLKRLDIVQANIDRFGRRGYLYGGLVTSHEPNHMIYNLDAILSFPRLLMEMLIFTKKEYLEIMPAWPVVYPNGSLKGMRIYGGHIVNISWKNSKLDSLVIHAAADENLVWKYEGKRHFVKLLKGKCYTWRR